MATRYKTCAVCGAEFAIDQLMGHHHPPLRTKFCSASCQAEARKTYGKSELRSCAYCGTRFRADRSHDQRFCSQSCAGRASAPQPLSTREPKIAGAAAAPERTEHTERPNPVWR